jgi:type II secretory pathway pseudopilin PulG
MAVMAILLSVAAMGIQRIDQGQATTTALAVSEAVFEEARSAAIGRGTRARVVIHNEFKDRDNLARERYLRYMFVSVLNENGQWEIASRGTTLPSGVYYDPDLSEAAAQSVGSGGSEDGLGTFGTAQMRTPATRSAQKPVYYYEFNSEGICVDGEEPDAQSGAAFVVVGGVRPPDRDRPIIKRNNKTGFIVWRNGRTSLFRNPNQIEQ